MASFNLPTATPSLLELVRSLEVELNAYVDEQTFEALSNRLGGVAKDLHGKFRVPVRLGSRDGELAGLVGIHNLRRENWTPSSAQDTGFWIHLEVSVRRRNNPVTENVSWEAIYSAVVETLGSRPLVASLDLDVPAEGSTPAVALPIELTEVPGFSHIRGVRLVKDDEKTPNSALYSVILQHFGTRLSVQARTEISGPLSKDVLPMAWSRALGVARLAVPSVEDK